MFLWLANWWDGVQLWLTELPFPFQFALVMVVLLPACLGLALVIDRAVDWLAGIVTHSRDDDPPSADGRGRARRVSG